MARVPPAADRARVIIVVVDPTKRRIDARMRDGNIIQIPVIETGPFFRWPQAGEIWNICRRNQAWTLESLLEQPPQDLSIEDMAPGDAKIQSESLFNSLGEKFVTGAATNAPTYVQTSSATPATPIPGQLYYDTDTQTLWWRNASNWVEVGTASGSFQPLDSDLTAISALTTTTFGRSLLTVADAAAGRTTLGAAASSHTHAQADITNLVTDLSNKQPLDSDLTSIAALTTTSYGRSFLAHVDAAASRAYIDAPSTTEAVLDTIINAKGDLLVGTAADVITRLPVGTNGDFLVADSTATEGVAWEPAATPESHIPGTELERDEISYNVVASTTTFTGLEVVVAPTTGPIKVVLSGGSLTDSVLLAFAIIKENGNIIASAWAGTQYSVITREISRPASASTRTYTVDINTASGTATLTAAPDNPASLSVVAV